MISTEARADIPTLVTAGRTLASALVDYRAKPTSPECYFNYEEAHWNLNRLAMGLPKSDVVVADVPWTEGQMRQFMGRGLRRLLVSKLDIPFYLPKVVSVTDGIPLLGKAYPWMRWSDEYVKYIQNLDREGNSVTLFGHLRTEAAIDAPYTKTNEDQAERILAGLGRRGHTVNTYVEAGNQGKLLTGEYLDGKRTGIRVMWSRARGRVLGARFDPSGRCDVGWNLRPEYANAYLGVRSVGI